MSLGLRTAASLNMFCDQRVLLICFGNLQTYFVSHGCVCFKSLCNFDSKIAEAVTRRCSVKKVFSKISQNSQENTCARVSFLIKLHQDEALFKKRLWHRCFPADFATFFRTFFFRTPLVVASEIVQLPQTEAFFGLC